MPHKGLTGAERSSNEALKELQSFFESALCKVLLRSAQSPCKDLEVVVEVVPGLCSQGPKNVIVFFIFLNQILGDLVACSCFPGPGPL